MTINDLIQTAHSNAVNKGWWDDERSHGESMALIHSEVSEALEELRAGRKPNETYYNSDRPTKPEGVPSELADIVIRVADYCGRYNIDLQQAIDLKMAFNATRPTKHGKVF